MAVHCLEQPGASENTELGRGKKAACFPHNPQREAWIAGLSRLKMVKLAAGIGRIRLDTCLLSARYPK